MSRFFYLIDDSEKSAHLSARDVGTLLGEVDDRLVIMFLRDKTIAELRSSEVVEFSISKTGDEESFKVCDRCFKYLSTELDFENNRIKKHGKITKRPSCRNCRRDKNGVGISASERRRWASTKPELFSAFSCPICEKNSIVGITKVVLDHCHKTGRVRGWICESCNTGIGRFDDDADIVQRAIDWLVSEADQT